MGNTCGRRPRKSQFESQKSMRKSKRRGKPSVATAPREQLGEQQIDQLLHEMKEYHLYRLRNELETDPHAFILDNILMCIQFFDNFEKSQESANRFKRDIEREMTDLLARDPLEGTILGDRRVKLLTGMGHVLAQNYIYRGKNSLDEEDADVIYGGMGFKDTFMAEGILPLEFTTTWDNLEVYDQSEYHQLKDYSDAKGASPITRFCMEQPDKKMNFPKGFVRLRCVDEPIALKKILDIPELLHHPHPEFEEPLYSNAYSDGMHSQSDVSSANSEPTSEDDDDEEDDISVRRFTEMIKNTPSTFPTSKTNQATPVQRTATVENQNFPSTSNPTLTSPQQNGLISSSSTTSRPKLSKLEMPQLKTEKNEQFPTFMVHAPTPPVREASYEMQRSPFESSGFLFPHSQPRRILDYNSRSTPNLTNPSRDSPGKETSSGYDTTSTRSRSSSMVSEMMRDKWQKLNLKKLWEFGKKSRKEEIPSNGRYDPLPESCYSEIKYEFSYDDEHSDDHEDDYDDDDESYTESDMYSDDGGFGGELRHRKKRRNVEDEYEMRFYLNSLQVSSNACSEFHYIGPRMKIPPNSMSNGVVLGTTIRCPIPYAYPKGVEDEDGSSLGSYYVTYTFTPSLFSKSWPEGLYFHFNSQVFSYARKSTAPGEMWPSREQMEKIQSLGCNAIPLGYRSVDFFNAEQILEWELKFQDCEVILLDSFKHSHWRAYIFASVLTRAFIAPLGPQGIGMEHIRNILYFMCHENFSGWNDEQPGLHLKILLDNFFSCLSRGHMPSFFVRARNLLQSIPQHNLRFVQGHLKQIRDNLLVYSIYAFRNLMDVRQKESYSFPNFKRLYKILTVEDTDLLIIQNSRLRQQQDQEDKAQREQEKQRARTRRRKPSPRPRLIDQPGLIDRASFNSQRRLSLRQTKPDKTQAQLQRRHRRHERMMEEQNKLREAQKLQHNPELRLPEAEKRKSIDLKKMPVIPKNFSPFRLLLTLQFFIKQFLKMASAAAELPCYDQATMYIFQVENLCDIMEDEKYRERLMPFQEDLMEYRKETTRLREKLGKNMEQYIVSRLAVRTRSLSQPSISLPSLPGSPIMTHFPTFINNWDLRKLPDPPSSTLNELRPLSGKTLSRPNIVSSFQSLESIQPPYVSTNDHNIPVRSQSTSTPALSVVEEVLPDDDIRAARRSESIKFVSPAGSRTASPANPIRKLMRTGGRTLSRESTFSLNLDEEEKAPATDRWY